MKKFRLEVLSLFGNFLNYTIFVFISINLLETRCFELNQMLITAFGLFTSLFIQLISVLMRK